MPINYEAMQREFPKQKSALTRAVNSGKYANVLNACKKAVTFWNDNGGVWPDDWSRWQRALDDAAYKANRERMSPMTTMKRLEEL